VVPKAQGIAARLMQEANGFKQSVISTAQGDASRFSQILAEYQKAPQVTRERMYLDTMQQVLGSTSKVIIDTKGANPLLYLPIDKLIQMGQSREAQLSPPVTIEPSPQSTQSSVPSPSTSSMSDTVTRRDALRSRDREAGR
jgi:membrane protease subunit HflK